MTEAFRLFKKVAYFQIFDNKGAIIKNVMEGIRFNEEEEFHIKSRKLFGDPTTPSMVRFLLRYGIVKNEKQALVVLIAFIAVVIFLTIYLSNNLLFNTSPSYVTDRFGNKYTPEQYFTLRNQGIDPLSPDFVK